MNHPNLHGVEPQRVVQVIKDRKARGYNPRSDDDGRKLALVVEGGAMRGVTSAGGALALSRLGYSHAFDEAFATSAGCMNVAYLLTDQANTGILVYLDLCTRGRFIRPWRFWKILDVDWLYDRAIPGENTLDAERLRAHPTTMVVAMNDNDHGTPFVIEVQNHPEPPMRIFKAAAAIPVFYNRTVTLDGVRCSDGGLLNPFPLRTAIERGCTDILVLLSRPAGYVREAVSRFQSITYRLLAGRGHPVRKQLLDDYPAVDRSIRELAFGKGAVPDGVRIATFTTDGLPAVPPTCSDTDLLWTAADQYGRNVLTVFDGDHEMLQIPHA